MFDLESLIMTYGVIGITTIVFLESGVFFGFFFPGDSLLFTAGFLASQGFLSVWVLYPALLAAAILGDSVGYYTGHRFGRKLFNRPKSFFFNPEHIVRTEAFFTKHGPMALVLARFTPIVRTFTPIFAGIGSMPYRTFIVYNVTGAFLWVTSLLLGGYFLGTLVPQAKDYIHYILVIIIVASFVPPVLSYLKEKNEIKASKN
jgi:membrane-associated protein